MSVCLHEMTVGRYSVLLRNGGGALPAPSLPQSKWIFLGRTKQETTRRRPICLLRRTLSISSQGLYGSNLLERRMAALNLDPAELALAEPALFRNFQRSAHRVRALCGVRGISRRNLPEIPASRRHLTGGIIARTPQRSTCSARSRAVHRLSEARISPPTSAGDYPGLSEILTSSACFQICYQQVTAYLIRCALMCQGCRKT